jgi:hypothetical protein
VIQGWALPASPTPVIAHSSTRRWTNTENGRFRLAPEPIEHPDERDAGIRRKEADAEHRRRQEMAVVSAVLAIACVGSLTCLWIVFVGQPAENVTWARTLLTAIVSGGLGYMTGKNSKSAS